MIDADSKTGRHVSATSVLLTVVDIDPHGSLGPSKESINSHRVTESPLSSNHLFRLCIILSCISSKRYSILFWHILSLY